MKEFDPYKAPETRHSKERTPSRFEPWPRRVYWVPRIILFLFGLYLLVGTGEPKGNVAYHNGQIMAHVLGAVLMFLAVFPFRKPLERIKSEKPEEL